MKRKRLTTLALVFVFALGMMVTAGSALAEDKVVEKPLYKITCADGWTEQPAGGVKFVKGDAVFMVSTQNKDNTLPNPEGAKEVSYTIDGITWKGVCIQNTTTMISAILSEYGNNEQYVLSLVKCTPDDADVKAMIESIVVKVKPIAK